GGFVRAHGHGDAAVDVARRGARQSGRHGEVGDAVGDAEQETLPRRGLGRGEQHRPHLVAHAFDERAAVVDDENPGRGVVPGTFQPRRVVAQGRRPVDGAPCEEQRSDELLFRSRFHGLHPSKSPLILGRLREDLRWGLGSWVVRLTLPALLGGGMRDSYLAARVLDALLREDYGDISAQITRSREGVGLTLSDGRLVRLAPGVPFQDFVVAPGQLLGLEQVLDTLAEIAPEEDADGVKAFFDECVAALAALDSHDARLPDVLARDPSYETLAAFADHPGYPTARARPGVPDGEQAAYAPEFGPAFELRWAVVPRRDLEPGSAELPPDVLTWEPDEPRSEPSDEAHPPA